MGWSDSNPRRPGGCRSLPPAAGALAPHGLTAKSRLVRWHWVGAVAHPYTRPAGCVRVRFGFVTCRRSQARRTKPKPKDVENVRTHFPKENKHDWLLIDAEGQTVGRLATQIAQLLRGKHKADFTPNQAGGDFVVVVNADKVAFSGRKLDQKVYTRYSGYQSGLKRVTAREMLDKHPERVLEHAVRGMLPKNRLGRKLIRRLKVYSGPAHPHQAQQPTERELV